MCWAESLLAWMVSFMDRPPAFYIYTVFGDGVVVLPLLAIACLLLLSQFIRWIIMLYLKGVNNLLL